MNAEWNFHCGRFFMLMVKEKKDDSKDIFKVQNCVWL